MTSIPEVLWNDFDKFTSSQKANKIPCLKICDLTFQQIYKAQREQVPLQMEPLEVYYNFNLLNFIDFQIYILLVQSGVCHNTCLTFFLATHILNSDTESSGELIVDLFSLKSISEIKAATHFLQDREQHLQTWFWKVNLYLKNKIFGLNTLHFTFI